MITNTILILPSVGFHLFFYALLTFSLFMIHQGLADSWRFMQLHQCLEGSICGLHWKDLRVLFWNLLQIFFKWHYYKDLILFLLYNQHILDPVLHRRWELYVFIWITEHSIPCFQPFATGKTWPSIDLTNLLYLAFMYYAEAACIFADISWEECRCMF